MMFTYLGNVCNVDNWIHLGTSIRYLHVNHIAHLRTALSLAERTSNEIEQGPRRRDHGKSCHKNA